MSTSLFSSAVRSIGSIALRKAEDIDFKYHFDFFSVNFNEELVALYGGSLQKQTKFVHECIKTILKLYKVSKSQSRWCNLSASFVFFFYTLHIN
jgi:hypothetical protein